MGPRKSIGAMIIIDGVLIKKAKGRKEYKIET